jgi:hypothetical protein
MKRFFSIFFAVLMIAAMATPAYAAAPSAVIPTFSIVSVVADTSVTVQTYNFPAGDSFDVLMNTMGTRGVNGIKVASISTGAGGSFTATFNIPAALFGRYRIAIRLQSNSGSGYYAYNWFYNNTAGNTGGQPGYTGIPTFSIVSVQKDQTVTIKTNNFPKNDTFKVLMNYMGTQGKNGIKVATVSSGAGGVMTFTFNIPDALKGQYKIAIRLASTTGSGYFAYNWFFNNTAGSGGTGGIPGYSGFPTFSITAVTRNKTVTVLAKNLPPNTDFNVLMGYMGTRGVGGYYVTTFNTGTGGTQTLTFTIPEDLKGQQQIAVRMQAQVHYAYNWFWNNSTN